MTMAIRILQREHRGIGAVLYCFEKVLDDIQKGRLEPDLDLFDAIIAYIQDFPDRFHHPKEDDHFFPLVAQRAPEVRDALAELKKQHHDGVRLTAALKWHLQEWRQNKTAFAAFNAAARQFIEFQRKHIGIEEKTIIPAATAHFTEADWKKVDGAFADNDDPLFGKNPKAVFDRLFSKIVELAPEPHGFAQRKEPKRPEAATEDFRQKIVNLHWI